MSDPTHISDAGDDPAYTDAITSESLAFADADESSDPTAAIEVSSDEQSAPAMPQGAVALRPVSGKYQGVTGSFQLELRVDVDGARPMRRVSGDFYQVTGGTTKYVGSFIIDAPSIVSTATHITIRGLGRYTFTAGAPVLRVTVPRRTVAQPPAPATAQFFTAAGAPGASYLCSWASSYFRTVRIETDRASDVTTPVFNAYNTGSLPSGGPARSLSVSRAYAEAGISMVPTVGGDVINVSEAVDARWSNAELHASMQRHFTLWSDVEQWAVWQVAAQLHDRGTGLLGIMFDQHGKQRQGCAVFHAGVGGTTADKLRLQLYTYVHELGHCFNLLHSWQKQYANPPAPNRPNALSWMNYPWLFPGGPAAFWNQFPFQFDTQEIIHLRHAFRNDLIMGGKNFIDGAALGRDVMADPVRDESGLTLRISTHQQAFALGEPVVLQIALGTSGSRLRRVHSWLHPNCGLVKVIISKPNGAVVAYEPLMDHLVGPDERMLGADTIEDSAYIGFGRDGFYFDQPGNYIVRAAYAALDGSEVLSEHITIRVRYPVTAADERLADLFMGEDQGVLLYLLGSDSETLQRGNDAFDQVLEEHAKHPLAEYARLVKGVNAGRCFKTITENASKRITVRQPKLEESSNLLAAVNKSGRLDPVTTNSVRAKLIELEQAVGNLGGTRAAE